MYMKTKGQRDNRNPIETLALFSVGAWEGSRRCGMAAHGRGFDSPRLHQQLLPASGCNRSRGMSSGMSRRQSWKPAVILALRPEESKGQNDLFKLWYIRQSLR
jgi:hypothetical protein